MDKEDQRSYESEEYYNDKKNLTQLKVKDLKVMAKQEGVSGYSKLKRNNVIDCILFNRRLKEEMIRRISSSNIERFDQRPIDEETMRRISERVHYLYRLSTYEELQKYRRSGVLLP